MEKLIALYKQWRGNEPAHVERLAGAGSNRVYYRLTDTSGHSVIGVIGTSIEENRAFAYLSAHFRSRKLNVPEVLAISTDESRYLQTDLGDTSLFDALRNGRETDGHYSPAEEQLLIKTIAELPRLQIEGTKNLDYSQCYPQAAFDKTTVLFDLNYFKYCFLKAVDVDFNELRLQADFENFAADLTAEPMDAFLYRDFQARNIMIDTKGKLQFIDFQGGRRGPIYYDLASFLWQASAKYSFKLRKRLIFEYYNQLKHYTEPPTKHHFVARLSLFVLFRLLQVLGAYGFRGYFERKPHFLRSIPPAIANLRDLLADGKRWYGYDYLLEILGKIADLPAFAQLPQQTATNATSEVSKDSSLVVRIFSFSYKKGIPEDTSGNGGGYVFDCRSIHNPGRYEPYKKLTGLDEPVIRFLEDDGEILTFLESVYALASVHVERYLARGFSDLMFSFGCTGGQHRSVYCAQHLAQYLHEHYGITILLEHREQGIRREL
ncbi:MAG: RNase adapter RapZ [Prevotella sp.]|nr:RNase adapter RapZ [Prevotellaceae bacterium]MDY3935964.1 RNase adapter RapZ [Prevotella sp.]